MLQDLEHGRTLEIDALLGAVVEIAGLVEVAVPVCELILGLVRQRARILGLYGR
jgi:2-dehydropantoate 2-reductase